MDDITPRDRREVEKWVVRMLDDPERHRPGLARWMLEKPGRRALYDRLLGSVENAGQAMSAPALDPLAAVTPRRRQAYFAVAAAALLLALACGAATYFWMPGLYGAGSPAVSGTTLATRLGEVREERLADGSVLTLDTDTQVHVRLSGSERLLKLERGRVRFSVAPNDRPFVVQVADSQVLAAGGVFDVSYRNRVAVNLLKGSLDLRLPGWRENAQPSRLVRLQTGEMLTFSAGQRTVPSVISALPSDGQWTSGVKSFDDVAIRDVIAEANSYSPVQIIVADPAMGERQIFGDIRIRDAENVASAVSTFLGARIDRSRPGQLIIIE